MPSQSTMAVVLNRSGYRLRTILPAKPKKLLETDAIFTNLTLKDQKEHDGTVK
ncbi:hypothetical protein [Acaryochloris sp. 'Moss Beach']|uniref:hypothetical protein n=1 Tax=Acaryochloris sp. 'Moss Beach' TaxID=2740837 RepID=UPI001F2F47B1|nr:hypothetical protein [Acaryochloris sp. 'Moss Beach']